MIQPEENDVVIMAGATVPGKLDMELLPLAGHWLTALKSHNGPSRCIFLRRSGFSRARC